MVTKAGGNSTSLISTGTSHLRAVVYKLPSKSGRNSWIGFFKIFFDQDSRKLSSLVKLLGLHRHSLNPALTMDNRIGKQSSLSQIPFWGVELSHFFRHGSHYKQSHSPSFSLGLLKPFMLTTAGGLIKKLINSAGNTSDSPSNTDKLQKANSDSKCLRIPAQKSISFCIAS